MLLYQVDNAHSLKLRKSVRHITARMRPGGRPPSKTARKVQLVHSEGCPLERRRTPQGARTTHRAGGIMAADDRGANSAKADFSDVQAGSSSTAPSDSPRTITVQAGDSLSKIAKRELGDA